MDLIILAVAFFIAALFYAVDAYKDRTEVLRKIHGIKKPEIEVIKK